MELSVPETRQPSLRLRRELLHLPCVGHKTSDVELAPATLIVEDVGANAPLRQLRPPDARWSDHAVAAQRRLSLAGLARLRANMDLGQPVETDGSGPVAAPLRLHLLREQAAVIDAHRQARSSQRGVLMRSPGFAPSRQHVVAVPGAGLHPSQPIRLRLAKREKNVRMVIAGIVALLGNRPMDGNVGHHALRHELLGDERPDQREPLRVRELVRQRHVDLARELRVAPLLVPLHVVPQGVTFA